MREPTQGNYRRGVMSLVILSLLKREDMYGYQLVQETERASGGKLTTQEIDTVIVDMDLDTCPTAVSW